MKLVYLTVNLFYLFLLVSSANSSSGESIYISANIGTAPEIMQTQNILHSFGGSQKTVYLGIINSIENNVALRVDFRQRSGKIAIPLGTVHQADLSNHKSGELKTNFNLKIPKVDRVSEFDLLYLVKKTDNTQWKTAGKTLLKVYPNDIAKDLYNYSKKYKLIVLDYEGELQEFFRREHIPFYDYENDQLTHEALSESETMITICNLQLKTKKHPTKKQIAEELDYITDTTDYSIIFKDNDNELSPLFVKENESTLHIKAESQLLRDVSDNPRSQLNLVKIFELIVTKINNNQ